MGWLSYSDDEVTIFHVEFEVAANEALKRAGFDSEFEWEHHPPRLHGGILPDFALRKKQTGEWVAVVEIKRRRESVFSTRYQYQAKSYAEAKADLFPINRPKYFILTNLEVAILFALNGARPPAECQIKKGIIDSGSFRNDDRQAHRERFIQDWQKVIKAVITEMDVIFDQVWPSVLDNLFSHIKNVLPSKEILSRTPASANWDIIQSYFGEASDRNACRLFLLRCLLAEYLRGALSRWGHPKANQIPPLRPLPAQKVPSSVANTIDKLRSVDFLSFFEDSSPHIYRSLSDPVLTDTLRRYVRTLVSSGVGKMAATRVDTLELLDSLFSRFYPIERLPLDGKIQTDPDLADVLSALAIPGKARMVYDAGCGSGTLLSAAFDRLLDLGVDERTALESISGLEADDISMRIAALRLALKSPKLLEPNLKIKVDLGDIFSNPHLVRDADIVLMNPPFKRYESQDEKPVPHALRAHYVAAIEKIDRKPAVTAAGQANLFNYYVEYVIKAASHGTRIGIILDNKWYHSRHGEPLRGFLLEQCEILAIVEYPHSLYFTSYTIATSLLIVRKVSNSAAVLHNVRFIRARTDPQLAGPAKLAEAMHNGGEWPQDWIVREVPQKDLDRKSSWKAFFSNPFENDFLNCLTPLGDLFSYSRRGSLNKEGGGTGVMDFPFNQSDYGPRRGPAKSGRRRPWQTEVVRKLTTEENEQIADIARRIPKAYRGWALRNADDLTGYVLTKDDASSVQTIEPPYLRGKTMYYADKRCEWSQKLDKAVQRIKSERNMARFIQALDTFVGLNETTLARKELWVALREPYAGELVVPRKLRVGHRVHINPFALHQTGRQIRTSSNFITYTGCIAFDPESDLDKEKAVRLIAAFLISSFGQVQFEKEGNNREGVLAVEKEQLDRIKVLDPRKIESKAREEILEAFKVMPYPVRTDRLSATQPERNNLDSLFAAEICRLCRFANEDSLVEEVHSSLDEWLDARQP